MFFKIVLGFVKKKLLEIENFCFDLLVLLDILFVMFFKVSLIEEVGENGWMFFLDYECKFYYMVKCYFRLLIIELYSFNKWFMFFVKGFFVFKRKL